MWIDTHCHIDAAEFDADRDAVMQAAISAGVERIIVPAVHRANFGAVASVCRTYPECRAAFGIHPLFVDAAREDDLAALRETLQREQALAVGEIGLDRFVPEGDLPRQEKYFVAQLELAREFNLPVILHVRRAIDPVLAHLRRVRVVGGIAHAFNGSRQQADEFIRLGFKLGFGGAMTYSRATRIRALAASLPLASIVLETDAPDIPPEWLGGGRNTPEHLPQIAQTLAQLRGMEAGSLAAVLRNTVASVFGVEPLGLSA